MHAASVGRRGQSTSKNVMTHVCSRELSTLEKGRGPCPEDRGGGCGLSEQRPIKGPLFFPPCCPVTERKLLTVTTPAGMRGHFTGRRQQVLKGLAHWSPTVLISGTGFLENSFSTDGRGQGVEG